MDLYAVLRQQGGVVVFPYETAQFFLRFFRHHRVGCVDEAEAGVDQAPPVAAAAASQLGLDLDKKKLVLPEPIKALGTYDVPVKLHKDVTVKLTVEVVAE